jgi:SAM-dependent methyltransferase
MSKHLDLGCGPVPRNPYRRAQLFGVDIVASTTPGVDVRRANLAIDPIPYADNTFDSVSAFDFLEHVPRVLPLASGAGTRFPFIELMNEVSRVLRPGGLFYALTPAYPATEAFSDPTHVNIMTIDSHRYFTSNQPLGRMYGFNGHFALKRAAWAVHKDSLDALSTLTLAQRFRRLNYRLKGKFSHMVWEFSSSKPGA